MWARYVWKTLSSLDDPYLQVLRKLHPYAACHHQKNHLSNSIPILRQIAMPNPSLAQMDPNAKSKASVPAKTVSQASHYRGTYRNTGPTHDIKAQRHHRSKNPRQSRMGHIVARSSPSSVPTIQTSSSPPKSRRRALSDTLLMNRVRQSPQIFTNRDRRLTLDSCYKHPPSQSPLF